MGAVPGMSLVGPGEECSQWARGREVTRAISPLRLSHTWQPLGATTLLRSRRRREKKEMLRRRSSNVYCPHNGVLCREEDLTLSAVCSTCAQAHLAQALPPTSTRVNNASNKDVVDSSSSSSTKLKQKRVVFDVPPLPEAEHHTVMAEEWFCSLCYLLCIYKCLTKTYQAVGICGLSAVYVSCRKDCCGKYISRNESCHLK